MKKDYIIVLLILSIFILFTSNCSKKDVVKSEVDNLEYFEPLFR